MDSLSQLVLGSAVSAWVTPAAHRRVALLAGAVFGTLPDLDVVPLSLIPMDPVTEMTWHRGPSHSLFLLPILGWLIWLISKRRCRQVREAPRAWFWAIQLALFTHPLLDAFTIYGTQLWWPIPTRPVMIGSMFIVDPLYTLPLLIACGVALFWPLRRIAQRSLQMGLIISTAYLGWSVCAQAWVDRLAEAQLAKSGLQNAPRIVMPTALTTLLWRVVVMTPEGLLEGQHSLIADSKPIQFTAFSSDVAAMSRVADQPAVQRLAWFNHGFMKAEERAGKLVLSDIRMGMEPDYMFRFVVAKRGADGTWRPVPVTRINWPGSTDLFGQFWQRLWHEP